MDKANFDIATCATDVRDDVYSVQKSKYGKGMSGLERYIIRAPSRVTKSFKRTIHERFERKNKPIRVKFDEYATIFTGLVNT